MQQEVVVAPPAPPAPPSPQTPSPDVAPAVVVTIPPGSSPAAVYQALTAKREVLSDQMSRLLRRRDDVREQLHSGAVSPAEKVALEQHLQELNTRIIDMEHTLHAADAEVAAAAGVPGAAVPESIGSPQTRGDDLAVMAIVFAGIAMMIIAVAWARRLWKGASTVVAQLPAAFEARFARMEESLDAVAIEVERVSEGQRFLSKLFAEPGARAIGAGPAQPVEIRAEAAEPIRRA